MSRASSAFSRIKTRTMKSSHAQCPPELSYPEGTDCFKNEFLLLVLHLPKMQDGVGRRKRGQKEKARSLWDCPSFKHHGATVRSLGDLLRGLGAENSPKFPHSARGNVSYTSQSKL